MRDVFERLVEQAEMRGFTDHEFFRNWFKGALMGLSIVVEEGRYVQFARDKRMDCIFDLLEAEGLVQRSPNYSGPKILAQPCYFVTESGKYLADQAYMEFVAAQTKH